MNFYLWLDSWDDSMACIGSRNKLGHWTAWGQIHTDGVEAMFGPTVYKQLTGTEKKRDPIEIVATVVEKNLVA
jgi:hypothetical protein